MTTQEYLCRHFARMGARVFVRGPGRSQGAMVAIDVRRDRSGELFVLWCHATNSSSCLGAIDGHLFASAVPGDSVRDVRTAIASLRPIEIEGREAIRQGEWFFVPEPSVNDKNAVVLRNEPLSRGGRSKPHICEELMRRGGEVVVVSREYPAGVGLFEYKKLTEANVKARSFMWRRMVRDAEVYARGEVRHRDHKTVDLYGWHRVYMNRERFAKHAPQIAFLD